MAISLICFDLGRVLVRICDTWAHACELAGVPVPPNPLPQDAYEKVHALVCAHETATLSHEAYCREMSPHLGITPAEVDRMMNGFLISLYPGALDLLKDLRKAGYKTSCLSNTNELHWQNMSDPSHPAYLPWDHFDHAFGSHDIGHRKPADEIYHFVENATGFKGNQILFFDDIDANILAARKVGWLAELIARDHQPIRQIREHLARLNVLPG